MAERVIAALYRTRKTIDSVLKDLDISEVDENEIYKEIDQCSICNYWDYKQSLRQDEDGFPTCRICLDVYKL